MLPDQSVTYVPGAYPAAPNPALQSDSRATVGALRALLFDAAAAERGRSADVGVNE